MLKSGTIFAERYGIQEKIGSGGMADVYKAIDTRLNREVAIKVLKSNLAQDPEILHRFRVEGRAAAGLDNENIIKVYDVGNVGSSYYIVMELVSGITLKEYIRRKGVLSARESMAITAQVAVGLRAAHAHHIVHRDIKPQNIILSRDGKVKVSDFGIARAVSDETKTVTTTAMGSVHYIAPEQAKGSVCDERSDIYSLGIVLYEMITGQVPFDRDTSIAVALAHMNETMTPPSELNPDCPKALEQIIFRCTQKSRERRYHNCTELLKDLKIAVGNPDFDFEKQELLLAEQGETQRIAEDDLNGLRGGALASSLTETARFQADEGEADGKEVRRGAVSGLFREDKEEDEKSIFDRIMLIVGIVFGALIICLLIYIIASFTGCAQKMEAWRNRPTQTVPTNNSAVPGPSGEYVPPSYEDPSDEVPLTTIPKEKYDPEKDTIVPDVIGMSVKAAIDLLKNADLQYKISTQVKYSDEYAVGTICEQSYPEGTIVTRKSVIVIIMSAGSDKFEVKKSYINGPLSVFQNDFSRFEDIIDVEYVKQYSDSVRVNRIISIDPSSGLVKTGDKITVVYSIGPEYVAVPNVVGLTRAQASQRLIGNTLYIANVTYENSKDVPADLVLGQQYAAGTRVHSGSGVDLVISLGPATATVPDMIGWPEEDAVSTLEELGLKASVTYDYNKKYEEGVVIKQSVEADTAVELGSKVTITVNREEEPATDESSSSESDEVAKLENFVDSHFIENNVMQRLNDAGFTNVSVSEEATDVPDLNMIVKSQSPAGGTGEEFPVSTEITIVYYVYQEPSSASEEPSETPSESESSESEPAEQAAAESTGAPGFWDNRPSWPWSRP